MRAFDDVLLLIDFGLTRQGYEEVRAAMQAAALAGHFDLANEIAMRHQIRHLCRGCAREDTTREGLRSGQLMPICYACDQRNPRYPRYWQEVQEALRTRELAKLSRDDDGGR